MEKMLIFGFSVTAEKDGYAPIAANIIEKSSKEISVDVKSIGGATFNLLPLIHNVLELKKYKYIILEISTCLRFNEDENYYHKLLSDICLLFSRNGAKIGFLIFHRDNIDYKTDVMSKSIISFCQRNNFPVLDATPEVVALREKGDEGQLLRDGTHTTPAGANFYAEYAVRLARTLIDRPPAAVSENGMPASGLMKIDTIKSLRKFENFEKGGISLPYLELRQDRSIDLKFNRTIQFQGLMLVIGANSAWGKITIPDQNIEIERHIYDNRCYYYRYAYWFTKNIETDHLKISALDKEPEVKLLKGDEWKGPRSLNIAGIFVRNYGDGQIKVKIPRKS